MKRNRPFMILITVLLFMLSSCFEITEEFTINENGSGEYAMKMDMYKMIEMISSMGGKDKMKDNKEFNEIKDTTVYFKNIVDTVSDLTAEEKALFKAGSMKMKMNLEEKQFFFRFNFPYSQQGDLQKIYDLTPKAMKDVDFKGLNKKDEAKEQSETEGELKTEGSVEPRPEMADANQYFDILTGKDFFEKKIKKDEWKKHIDEDSTMKQMMPMLGSVYFTSVIHLPRPAKNVNHPYAQFSEDKKTVTFKFPFSDYIERPEVLNFRIEY